MIKKSEYPVEYELYSTRFRRELNSLTRAIYNPTKKLQRVVVKSRHTGEPLMVMMSPRAYDKAVSYLEKHRKYRIE